MINAFYTAASGAKWQQAGIDVASNNIANVNTTGYKSQNVNFSDLLYTNMLPEDAQEPNLQVGSGVRIQETAKNFTQGTLEQTGRPLDLAIEGDGFFAVEAPNGNRSFTRNGSFTVSVENDNMYLVTKNGEYVLDGGFNRIPLKGSVGDVVITASARPALANAQDDTVKIGVFSFKNPYALNLEGNSGYGVTARSGEPELAENARVKQNSLESSSVDVALELSKIIQSQRGFQFNARIIQTADEIEQMANSLRN